MVTLRGVRSRGGCDGFPFALRAFSRPGSRGAEGPTGESAIEAAEVWNRWA
jgi:hypothetical protein